MKTVVIIGGGASGLMAAAFAADGAKVILLERNEKAGKKIYITGKGRCNLTNVAEGEDFLKNVVSNDRFLYSALSFFPPSRCRGFFEENRLRLKVERGGRVFPESDKASDVTNTLLKILERKGVEIRYNCNVVGFEMSRNGGNEIADSRLSGNNGDNIADSGLSGENRGADQISRVITDRGVIDCDAVILATGGRSYPSTGSNGAGYLLARSIGHTVTPVFPSLTGLKTAEVFSSGLTLKNINASLFIDGVKIGEDFGELLFTHSGVSGPVVLTLSAYLAKAAKADYLKKERKAANDGLQYNERRHSDNTTSADAYFDNIKSANINSCNIKNANAYFDNAKNENGYGGGLQYGERGYFSGGRVEISIDFKPALSHAELDARILRDFSTNLNKDLTNVFGLLLPVSIIPDFIRKSGVRGDAKVNSVTAAERKALVKLLKDFRLSVCETDGFDAAVVTSGGVSVKEISPSSMRSKLVENLYFCGEIIDVDALTGGFNLQIAFSTGALAGASAVGGEVAEQNRSRGTMK